MELEYWQNIINRVYSGNRFIVTSTALMPAHQLVKKLEEFGAEALGVVSSRGTGAPKDAQWSSPPVVLDELIDCPVPAGDDTMRSVRHALALLADPPPEAVARVNTFDPERRARVIGPIFDDGTPFCGRAKFGARPPPWQALEDKTIIDALWEEAGVPHAPYQVVAMNATALAKAHAAMNMYGEGSVFAVDNGKGFHGGASGTQWIQIPEHVAGFMEHFKDDGISHVRVMPFLEGTPCSIHGIVFPEHTVTLRPCEMLIFRAPGERKFYYAGSATFWDPGESVRDAMRERARSVGEHLRARCEYRGAFTIDGILTRSGEFLPTELNPRFGAALGHLTAGLPELPSLLLNLAIVESDEVEWRACELELLMREGADSERRGAVGMNVPQHPAKEWSMDLHLDGAQGWRIAAHEEAVHAHLGLGASGTGGYLRVSPSPAYCPGPEPFAPAGLALLRYAGTLFGLGMNVNTLESAKG